ncbi:MAG TPA: SDR family oxidoreductase [Rhizomicrobium sp.]|nr:SDR family oxidoreductase [Rhizomicrobium sp.]
MAGSIVVTGASTGIGRATVKVLRARGFQVFAGVRRLADAEELKREFSLGVTPLVFDVTDRPAIFRAREQVHAALGAEPLSGLVNNAGIAVPGLLLMMQPQEVEHQLAVNVMGTLNVSQAFAPLLGARPGFRGRPGRIVMMSSVGGTSATPFLGAYNTSKFALEGMSEALRRELMRYGVDVLVIAPGAVKTPIWGKSQVLSEPRYAEGPYAGALEKMRALVRDSAATGLEPEAIGEAVYQALAAPHPPVRRVITPTPVQHFLTNHLPKRMVDRMIAKKLGLKRNG